jgi:hypothetical protein
VELGSIGQSKSRYNLDNDYNIQSLPILENKIRLDIQLVHFDKKTSEVYTEKITSAGQQGFKINYVDSLHAKPQYALFSIMDAHGFVTEINAPKNKSIATYLTDTKDAVVVTSIALVLPQEKLDRIKVADTYYLVNAQDKKYTIALYKDGKKTDVIDLQQGIVIAYSLSKFCWAVNERDQWYIADIVKDNKSCKGNTRTHVKEKEQQNLFKM